MRSMTKLYAIPGLRLGYLVASADVVAELGRALEPWSVSGPAAAVGLACLAQTDSWRAEVRTAVQGERAHLKKQLAAIPGFTVFPSAANFLMFEVRRQDRFSAHMLEHRIAVRDLSALPGAVPGWFRIAVRGRTDNDRLLEAARAYPATRHDLALKRRKGAGI